MISGQPFHLRCNQTASACRPSRMQAGQAIVPGDGGSGRRPAPGQRVRPGRIRTIAGTPQKRSKSAIDNPSSPRCLHRGIEPTKKRATQLFIREYKAGAIDLPQDTLSGKISLSWATLYRWEKPMQSAAWLALPGNTKPHAPQPFQPICKTSSRAF